MIISIISESIARVGYKAPNFNGMAHYFNKFLNISLNDYKDAYLVLFFYPRELTTVCYTELIELSKNMNMNKFREMNAYV